MASAERRVASAEWRVASGLASALFNPLREKECDGFIYTSALRALRKRDHDQEMHPSSRESSAPGAVLHLTIGDRSHVNCFEAPSTKGNAGSCGYEIRT